MAGDAKNQSSLRSIGVLIAVALGCAVLFTGAIAGVQADEHTAPAEDESSFVVDVQSDGTAAVVITYTFDLDDDDEQAAFDDLRNDEAAVEMFRDRFEARMSDVAADASAETDREMSISDLTVETERIDGTGVVTVSLTWAGLASTADDRLTVTEPFASGFEPDRPLYVTFPDGYEIDSSTPEPEQQEDRQLVWQAGTDLTGFETVATATDDGDQAETTDDETAATDDTEDADAEDDDTETDDEDGADDSGPGFGPITALGAVVAGGLFALRRS